MQICVYLLFLFILFYNFRRKMLASCFGGKWRSCPVVFSENLWVIQVWVCTRGVCGYGYIHEKSVDMDMDVDGKFHIHGKSVLGAPPPLKIWEGKKRLKIGSIYDNFRVWAQISL